jgi:ABC-type transport system substrate-binding protein
MLDLRVRQAIAHTVDKQALSDGVFDGQATIADTFVSPDMPYFAELDRALTKYPFDPRRAEQLMGRLVSRGTGMGSSPVRPASGSARCSGRNPAARTRRS